MKRLGKTIAPMIATMLIVAMILALTGCSGDDADDVDPARVVDLENSAFVFTNGAAFGINQGVTLTIADFDESGLLPVAPYTLSSNPTAFGIMTLTDVASDDVSVAVCHFDIVESDFSVGEGPQGGSQIEAECAIGEGGEVLQVRNRATDQTSSGSRM